MFIKVENLEFRDKKDSIDVVFHILEKANPKESIPAIILQESDSFEYKKRKQTNRDGRLTLTKPRNQKSEKYRIFFIGLERFEFNLENDQSKKVTIELAPESPKIISDQIFWFDLSKVSPLLFVTQKGEQFKKIEP